MGPTSSNKTHKFKVTIKPRGNIPETYGPTSNATYYTEAAALAVKVWLDRLNPEDRSSTFRFPAGPSRSVHTIQKMLNDGFRWLVDKMDTPDGKYAGLRRQITVSKRKRYCLLQWNRVAKTVIHGHIVQLDGFDVKVDEFGFKGIIRKWCEESKDGAVDEAKVKMNEDDLDWLHTYVGAFPDVLIIRANYAGYKLWKNKAAAEELARRRGVEDKEAQEEEGDL